MVPRMTTMRLLTEDDLAGAAGEAFRRVFRTVAYSDVTETQSICVEPHREPFQAGVERRLILWEVLAPGARIRRCRREAASGTTRILSRAGFLVGTAARQLVRVFLDDA